jgi:hypothetical protein
VDDADKAVKPRPPWTLAALVVVALLAPAAAHAAVVELAPKPPFADETPNEYYTARFVAGSRPDGVNEVNHLKMTFDFGGPDQGPRVTFHDPGALIDARFGCVEVDAHTASCSEAKDVRILDTEAYLGYGNDSLTTSHPQQFPRYDIRAFGGHGDDTMNGGPEDDAFEAGGGHGRLFGGDGRDTLDDGDRSGAPGDEGPDSDVLDGGPGADTLSYDGRKRGVTADAASSAPTGEKGENDHARRFESVIGGSGDDRLYGDDGDNTLDGRNGDDLLVGRGGDDDPPSDGDTLIGGNGRDRLFGGPGRDGLLPGPGLDSLSCDGGRDEVVAPAVREVVGHCERVLYTGENPDGELTLETDPRPVKIARTHVDFGIPCPGDSDGVPVACRAKVELRARSSHRLLGAARLQRGFGDETAPVRIRLNRLGRRLISRARGVTASLRVRGVYPIHGVGWSLRLRRHR